MDESFPKTQSSGSLVPPPGGPPTAIATSAPLPPRPSRPNPNAPLRRIELRALVHRTLGQLDTLADGIAEMVGLR